MKRFMSYSFAIAAGLALAATATPAIAQTSPLAVEARFGLGFPTGDASEGLGTGYGLGANVSFNLAPAVALYGGYSYTSFDYDEDVVDDFLDQDAGSFNLQGFEGGARLSVPAAGFSPYLKGGVVYYQGKPSGVDYDTDSELGYQAGVGLDYALGQTVSLTPEVSYVHIPSDGGDFNFVRADFGLRFRM